MSRSPQITVPEEHERGEPPWKTITLVIALLALMLIIAYGVVSVSAPEVKTGIGTGAESISAVENPELILFHRYKEAARARAEMTFLANNPEIMIMQRYADLQAAQREATFLAQNPEIMAVRRYAETIGQHADTAFLARNPEINVFRRYVSGQE